MMNPAWIIMPTDPVIKPNMLAAKMIPAEVMTDPVLATVLRTPTRMLLVDSSRSRDTSSHRMKASIANRTETLSTIGYC